MESSRLGVNPRVPPKTGATGRRYAGVDPDERERQRRAKLISAALVVFGEKGFHHATVRDVCEEARLTSRYLYESFASMEALFAAAYDQVRRSVMAETFVALTGCPPVPEQLAEAGLRAFLGALQRDPLRARFALIDALTVGPDMALLAAKANDDFVSMVVPLIHQLMPKLAQSDMDVKILADGLIGATNRIATQWVADKCRTPFESVLKSNLALFRACIDFADRLPGPAS